MSLEKEFAFYLESKDLLLMKYVGRYVVIKNQEVIGAYDSKAEAVAETSKSHEMGTFLVQLCEPGPESHTQTFRSRIARINHV
jgi:hypothetical protein